MALGLNASLKTFTSGTVISSADVNSDFSALNTAPNPTFTTVTAAQFVGSGAGGVARIAVYDTSGGLGLYYAAAYIGTTDPATVGGLSVANGDLWWNG